MEPCEFCRIVAGEADAHVLAETERTVAFLDGAPATSGHTLVVPKPHRTSLFTGDESTQSDVFRTVRRVVSAMHRTIEPDGVSLFYTSGELVGQVTHAHVHLLPRYADDDVRLSLPREPLGDDAAVRLAGRLRGAL